MPLIGQFIREKHGFFGRIQTFCLNAEIVILAAEPNEAENAPDYRLHIGGEDGPEVGAGWKRSSDKAGIYIAVSIDDPVLPQPIRANLFQNGNDKSSWSLHWNRQRDPSEKD